MSQRITKKRSALRPASRNGKNLAPIPEAERLLEVKACLRMEADEARRKYVREMVMAGAAVFVIVNACVISLFLIYSSQVSGDRQTGIILFTNVLGLVLGAVYGRNVGRLKR